MHAVLRAPYPRLKSLHTLSQQTEQSPRLVLIANKIWLLRHLRRFASHLDVRLETLRTLEDLDSISSLDRYDMILLLQGGDEPDDLYMMQCLHLFWGEIPVVLITSKDFHVQPIDLPANVRATLTEALGWQKIFSLAIEICHEQREITTQSPRDKGFLNHRHLGKGTTYANLTE